MSEQTWTIRPTQTFIVLLTVYTCVNLVARWLNWPLFHGHGAYGWPTPDGLTLAWMAIACLAPVWVLLLAAVVVIDPARDRGRVPVTLIALSLAGLVFVEADMGWFALSRRHLSATELSVFLNGNWAQHIGLTTTDVFRFLLKAAVHSVAIGVMALLATRLPAPGVNRRFAAVPVVVLVSGVCAFTAATGHVIANGDRQLRALLTQHPFRLNGTESVYLATIGRQGIARELNTFYGSIDATTAADDPNPIQAAMPNTIGVTKPDIVFIAIEGLSNTLSEKMPTLTALKPRALQMLDHHSTGNATHYGLLGLTHGLPMLFYGPPHSKQSSHVAMLARSGYRTKRFGIDIKEFGKLEQYTKNFTEPVYIPENDAQSIPALHRFMSDGPAPKFAMVYYAATHWPYAHAAQFSRHQPEVADDFDYTRPDLPRFRTEITNRYLNTLDEADDWLSKVLAGIDLDRTVVVITGDHGEELLEHGRLSHASGLFAGQVRTPLLIHLPGGPSGTIRHLTSHAQIFPALLSALGLVPAGPTSDDAAGESVALVAHNGYTNRPREWALVDRQHKVLFRLGANDLVDISAILDRQDTAIDDWSSIDRALLARSLARLKQRIATNASGYETDWTVGAPTHRTAQKE